MAKCVSCGREAMEGQFFCPQCFAAITPGEKPQPAGEKPQAPEAKPQPPGEMTGAAKGPAFTPDSEKKVVKSAPLPPGGKGKASPVSGGAGAKKEKAPKPVRQGPSRKEKAKQAAARTGQAGKRAGLALKGAALRAAIWVKGLALTKNAPYERADWIAWGVGTAASLLLLAAVFFMGLLNFGWMPMESDAFMATYTLLKAMDLGIWGYTLIVLSLLILLMNIWSVASMKLKIRAGINPAFLTALLCIGGLVTITLAMASNGAIMRAIVDKTGVISVDGLGYAKKTIHYGAYVAVFSLVVVFAAAAARLADRKALPEWSVRIAAWTKEKVMTAGRSVKKKRGLNA